MPRGVQQNAHCTAHASCLHTRMDSVAGVWRSWLFLVIGASLCFPLWEGWMLEVRLHWHCLNAAKINLSCLESVIEGQSRNLKRFLWASSRQHLPHASVTLTRRAEAFQMQWWRNSNIYHENCPDLNTQFKHAIMLTWKLKRNSRKRKPVDRDLVHGSLPYRETLGGRYLQSSFFCSFNILCNLTIK